MDETSAAASQEPDASRARADRTFSHRLHTAVSCLACHGAGDSHRTFLVRSTDDCAACHHRPARAVACSRCHGNGPRATGTTRVRFKLTVWQEERSRQLPFFHDDHDARECTECHRADDRGVMPRVRCGQCHESHHRPEADCSTCHDAVPRAAHSVEAHLSCAGAGCHAASVAPAPLLSRSLCLVCHAPQVDHEPGLACAECHVPDLHGEPDIPMRSPAAAGETVGVLARVLRLLWAWLR